MITTKRTMTEENIIHTRIQSDYYLGSEIITIFILCSNRYICFIGTQMGLDDDTGSHEMEANTQAFSSTRVILKFWTSLAFKRRCLVKLIIRNFITGRIIFFTLY